MEETFTQVDFGPLIPYLQDDNVTDISYSNHGQIWLKTLDKGVYRIENAGINDALMEKIAFQCANAMGKSFNMANPFLDAESAELRMNFVHDSIARNGVAVLIRKTPAKIRLNKDKIINEDYIRLDIHDFLIQCVEGHCNILVSGETGSGKTEFIKYLAAHTKENEKLITIEDTLELHLDRIFPTRDIVAMKTNNIASYSDVLVTCMRQNPRWILLSEVRSAEAVMAVRNSISSGHNILSTIHADKAASIPNRLYSLLESNIDLKQFLTSIHRYVQLGVHIKGYYSTRYGRFHREVAEVTEFYVTEENVAESRTLYKKTPDGHVTIRNPSKYLLGYLESQGVIMQPDILIKEEFTDPNDKANFKPPEDLIMELEPQDEQSNQVTPEENNSSIVTGEPQTVPPNQEVPAVSQTQNSVGGQQTAPQVMTSPPPAAYGTPQPTVSQNPAINNVQVQATPSIVPNGSQIPTSQVPSNNQNIPPSGTPQQVVNAPPSVGPTVTNNQVYPPPNYNNYQSQAPQAPNNYTNVTYQMPSSIPSQYQTNNPYNPNNNGTIASV